MGNLVFPSKGGFFSLTGVQTNDDETLAKHVDLHGQQEIGEHQGFPHPSSFPLLPGRGPIV